MSLLTALNTGTTGMAASSQNLSVIGDNIANANTIGFKEGRAAFEDALVQEVIGTPGGGQLGDGVNLQAIQRIITQGALTQTGISTDLALQGSGQFIVKGNLNGVQSQFYTRDGQFTVDKSGYLVNLVGLRLQGYPADSKGVVQGGLGDLLVGTASANANATKAVTMKGNLAADAKISGTPAFDPLDPTGTSNTQSSVTVYDSLGQAHTVDVYYRKTAAGTWDYHAMTDGAGLTGGTPGVATEIASGTLTFDANGKLTTQVDNPPSFNPIGATNPQPLTFNFGDPTATGGTGVAGFTQFGGTNGVSATTFTGQDGNGFGALSSVNINNKGEVLGSFTNGSTRVLGQVAVADFKAADKLQRVSGNLAIETTDSGQPTIGEPASGGRGSIASGALEQSNVDLAGEFVNMISAQRAFQANSKTITTADSLLGELMQLKR
jgi:flagellar hook protein FlgE